MVRRCVWYGNLKNEAMALVGPQHHRKMQYVRVFCLRGFVFSYKMRYETKFYNWDLFCVIGGKIFKFYIVIFTDGKILNSTLLYSQMKNI